MSKNKSTYLQAGTPDKKDVSTRLYTRREQISNSVNLISYGSGIIVMIQAKQD